MLTALAGVSTLLTTAITPATANPNTINPIPVLNGSNGLPNLAGRSRAVFQMTGMASPNNTQTYNVLGTDLGIMWDNGKGELLTAFGDTAGLGFPNLLAGSMWSWRSNILMRSHTTNPVNGIYFDSVVRDVFGQARDLIPSPKIPFLEISRIPTAGISVGDVQFMSLMSVRSWDEVGQWSTNFSSLAASGDNGETWGELPATRRPDEGGNGNFQMNAFLKDGGFVYEYGTPSGRNQAAFVARVPEAQITDLSAYEYWDGNEWRGGGGGRPPPPPRRRRRARGAGGRPPPPPPPPPHGRERSLVGLAPLGCCRGEKVAPEFDVARVVSERSGFALQAADAYLRSRDLPAA
ncbi:DUF4185 domain-containing protein [Nocardia brasiliensis]|uniref:DUF4185 domain-containing protein n=1 Tax=Nocardia brasiliensis TaxID=37326 RepID=UPI00245621CC|nr:DUF4185 domain-containing protein [Nocardia brasiliensis]